MRNEPEGKYAGLSALRKPEARAQSKPPPESAPSTITVPKPAVELSGAGELGLPVKVKPVGKRRNADFCQKSVLLRVESVATAEARLEQMKTGNDFSELIQVLLDRWLTGN